MEVSDPDAYLETDQPRPTQRHIMQIDPDAPGLLELLRGEGAPFMRALAWAAVLVLLPLLVAGTLVCWGAVL
jgi:hypothetical protein